MRGRSGLLVLVFFVILSVGVSADDMTDCNIAGGVWCENSFDDVKCVYYGFLSQTNNELECSIMTSQEVHFPDFGNNGFYTLFFDKLSFDNGRAIQFRSVFDKGVEGSSEGGEGGDGDSLGTDGATGGAGGGIMSIGKIGSSKTTHNIAPEGAGGKVSETTVVSTVSSTLPGAQVYIIAEEIFVDTKATLGVNGLGNQDYMDGNEGGCEGTGCCNWLACSGGGGGAGASGAGILYLYVNKLSGSGNFHLEAKGGKGGDGGDGGEDNGDDDGGGGGAGAGGDGGNIYAFTNDKGSVEFKPTVLGGTSGSGGGSASNAQSGKKPHPQEAIDGDFDVTFSSGEEWEEFITNPDNNLNPPLEKDFGLNVCNDEIDNDGNGKIDMQDISCYSLPTNGICPDNLGPISFANLLPETAVASAFGGKDGCCGDDEVEGCFGDGGTIVCSDYDPCPDACSPVFGDCQTDKETCISNAEAAGQNCIDNIDFSNIVQFVEDYQECIEHYLADELVCLDEYATCVITPLSECTGTVEFKCESVKDEDQCADYVDEGCSWDTLVDIELFEDLGDYFYFDINSKFFCSKDYDSIKGVLASPKGDWKWWSADADDPDFNYKIHTISFERESEDLFVIGDSDGDGVDDNVDNCPGISNSNQANFDNDDLGDDCDDDIDGDGVSNDNDKCSNGDDNLDMDNDGTPDACDDDKDGDGVNNDVDNCPSKANDQTDSDGDGVGDACDRQCTPQTCDDNPDWCGTHSDGCEGEVICKANCGSAGKGLLATPCPVSGSCIAQQ